MPSSLDFLDDLPLSPEQRDKLARLGVSSFFALLGMIRASKEAFASYYGEAETDRLMVLLQQRVTPEQLLALDEPVPRFSLGAAMEGRGQYQPPPIDLERRERLFQLLEHLRLQPDGENRYRSQIEKLEQEIASIY